MNRKLLLVTFPVDLGNTTFEKRFVSLFENAVDLQVYRFEPDQQKRASPNSNLAYAEVVARRLLSSYYLCRRVSKAYSEDRKVLFHGISPALFAYAVTKNQQSYIVTDWTKKLYEPLLRASLSPNWITVIHRRILKSQRYIFGITDAVLEQIAQDYNVSKDKLKKAKLPFCPDLDLFAPSPNRNDSEVRLLFVGGDFERKGGHILLRWFSQLKDPNIKLTVVTKKPLPSLPNLTVESTVEYGQPQHTNLFKTHDIFVLPTTFESYPSVVGEAACAGLAVLTTKNALGAPEIISNGINGYICSSQEDLICQLELLIENKPLIESMKEKSRKHMEENFSYEAVLSDYINYIFQ